MSTTSKTSSPRMSDAAVKAKTGRDWKQWFTILDKAGAKQMSHREIAALLNSKYEVGPWWGQMVTVTYEQDRGLRDKHQKPGGYEITVSRTISAPLATAFKAFSDDKQRSRWLKERNVAVRTTTPNKSMRMRWTDGKTVLAIAFAGKNEEKTQVVVQHSKLPDAKSAANMKTYWAEALDHLSKFVS